MKKYRKNTVIGNIVSIIVILVFSFLISEISAQELEPVNYSLAPIQALLDTYKNEQKKDYKRLWDSCARLFREEKYGNSFEVFKRWRKSEKPEILGARFGNMQFITENRVFVIATNKDFPYPIYFHLIKEDGTWKHCSVRYSTQRVKKDMRLLAEAIEKYRVDNGSFPQALYNLVSPTPYISKIPTDVFNDKKEPYVYKLIDNKAYLLYSYGPDSDDDLGFEYNCDNGEISNGDIILNMHLLTKPDYINYSLLPIQMLLETNEYELKKNYRKLWDLCSSLLREEKYGNSFEVFKRWRKSEKPAILGARFGNMQFITENRVFVTAVNKDIINKLIFYLVRVNGHWKHGGFPYHINRAKKDMRLLAEAIEKYRVDNGSFPQALYNLVSPTPYISKIPTDVFNDKKEPYVYKLIDNKAYLLYSYGPDSDDDLGFEYNCDNGEISNGDIIKKF